MRLKSIMLSIAIVVLTSPVAIAGEPQYPSEFPSTFPQYKGCKMVQIMNFPENITAMLDCGKTSAEDVYAFYLNSAKKDGWKVLMENKTTDFNLMMLEKSNTAMQIQVITEDGAVHLGLSYIQRSN